GKGGGRGRTERSAPRTDPEGARSARRSQYGAESRRATLAALLGSGLTSVWGLFSCSSGDIIDADHTAALPCDRAHGSGLRTNGDVGCRRGVRACVLGRVRSSLSGNVYRLLPPDQ